MQLYPNNPLKHKLRLYLSNYDADDNIGVLHFIEAITNNVVLRIKNL